MISSVNMLPDIKLGVVVLSNGLESPTNAITYYTLDKLLGIEDKDWSQVYLERINNRPAEDRRITKAREARVEGTEPSLPIEEYAGKYKSDIYGIIEVKQEDNKLRVYFEHAPAVVGHS